MKRILIVALALIMALSVAACGKANDPGITTEPSITTTPSTPDTPSADQNKGELKTGVYTGTSSYSSGEMNMTWNFVLTLKADGTFTLANDAGEEKGAGTYAPTEDCYTLSYSDDRSCTFVVQEGGTLKMTTDFPYGIATIKLELVGDIIFTYQGEASENTGSSDNNNKDEQTGETFSIEAGTYAASYTKESAMAGTVVYEYSATLGEDGSFSYSVKFDMGGTTYDGSAATGTYTVDGNKFVFTDSENNVTEGQLTADNTLVISLKASAMAKEPYEVTFVPAA